MKIETVAICRVTAEDRGAAADTWPHAHHAAGALSSRMVMRTLCKYRSPDSATGERRRAPISGVGGARNFIKGD